MDIEIKWKELKNLASFHDKRKALSILKSLPIYKIQEDVIDWFEMSESMEVKYSDTFIVISQKGEN